MDPKPKRRWDNDLSSMNDAIEAMNLAREVLSITPAMAGFGSVRVVLTMIRDSREVTLGEQVHPKFLPIVQRVTPLQFI